MNWEDIVQQLRQERALLLEAIRALEVLARGRPRGRGRPPKWLADVGK